jgi:Ca-activated chloride channel family protein
MAAQPIPAPTPSVSAEALLATAPPQAPVEVNPFVRTTDDHLSTFALDVDTASYTAARGYLNSNRLPPPELARVEEFVNYFHYDYPAPQQDTFGLYVDAAPSPFGQHGTQIVRVGIQGKRIDSAQRQDAVLTFVIDISGSMAQPARLPLVKQALRLLVDELRPSDQVAVVVYGSTAQVVLDHTGAADRDTILQAIDSLANGGSTNAEAGLQLGYQIAAQHFKPGAINRVILCSDGVANVGATGPDAIRQSIRDYTAQGVYLTTVGFGMGDYNDTLMEQLADDGNGNYAYVDTLDAARRVFVENLTGTLQVIAKDAKVQVDFNPAVVSSYRLLGYENRAVADADFRNDRVDAGELGAGHSVTALYEITLTNQGQGDALVVQMRYADPQGGAVHELRQPFGSAAFGRDFASASPRFQQAVAAATFAELLRGSQYTQQRTLDDVLAITRRIAPQLAGDGDVQELAGLVERAAALQP